MTSVPPLTAPTTPAVVPSPPMDDPSVSDIDGGLSSCPPLRWGILGCGRISHDFCLAVRQFVPTATLVACAARSDDDASAFAQRHGIATFYGSYSELVANPNVDIVYVGNVHAFRRSSAELCLNANKHVLLEKPMACNVEDAQYLMNLARERGLFLMEGVWTRFFPAVEQARRLLHVERVIGEVVSVVSDFNFNALDSDPYPTSYFYNHGLGGSATYVVGPYPLSLILLAGFYQHDEPVAIKAVGQVDPPTGVDLQVAAVLSFPPRPGGVAPALDNTVTDEQTPKLPGCGNATIHFGFLGESLEETTFLGTQGRLVIQNPTHCPTKVTVYPKAAGQRGKSLEPQVYDYPLPKFNGKHDGQEYFFPNSEGLAYEAAAVARCIAAGKREAPQYTQAEALQVSQWIQEIRHQLGVTPLAKEEAI